MRAESHFWVGGADHRRTRTAGWRTREAVPPRRRCQSRCSGPASSTVAAAQRSQLPGARWVVTGHDGRPQGFRCGWVTTARPPPGPAAVRRSFRGLRKRACAVAWQQDACRHTYRLVKAPAPAENPCRQMVHSGARISANTGLFHSRIEPACSYVSCACGAHLKIKKSKFLAWESAMPWMAVWPAKSAARRERKSANRPPPSLLFLPLLSLPFSSSLLLLDRAGSDRHFGWRTGGRTPVAGSGRPSTDRERQGVDACRL